MAPKVYIHNLRFHPQMDVAEDPSLTKPPPPRFAPPDKELTSI